MSLGLNVAKGQAALQKRDEDKRGWLGDSIAKLGEAREQMRAEGLSPTAVGQLYMRAHDLKGLGTLCGFPVISRLATSVCMLFDDKEHLPAEQMGLVDDHLDAIRALFDGEIASEDDPRAAQLLDDLERELRER